MNELIVSKLKQIENDYNVKILLAVESGSRAWGFASPDSDYDVRFIYVRPENDYLKLEKIRDVIELPINEELDINGWDLQKALRLLYCSNPTLFEWLSSPIVYTETEFAEQIRKITGEYFSAKKSLNHYLSMAQSNYRAYLNGEKVIAKKYFYVLRPVLACRWIIDKSATPPMLFLKLSDAQLPEYLKPEVERLLDLKMNSPEVKEIPKIDILNRYFDESIADIKSKIDSIENSDNDWDKLNDLFLRLVT